MNRATPTELINALSDCEVGDDVCEICATVCPSESMTLSWVGSDARGESVTHCKDCTVEGGAA